MNSPWGCQSVCACAWRGDWAGGEEEGEVAAQSARSRWASVGRQHLWASKMISIQQCWILITKACEWYSYASILAVFVQHNSRFIIRESMKITWLGTSCSNFFFLEPKLVLTYYFRVFGHFTALQKVLLNGHYCSLSLSICVMRRPCMSSVFKKTK